MRPWIVSAAIAAALAAAPGHAVTLAARGGGQVLLFPYYSVDRGLQTLVSIANPTDRGKALRVNFREGRNSRALLPFNLYLAPHDSWTAAIFAQREDGPAALLTLDRSCTVPRIVDNPSLPLLDATHRYVSFRNFEYSGAHGDDGPEALERTREGAIEVIEMATIVPQTATAAVVAYGADGQRGCAPLSDAFFATDGYWRADASTNLANPTGGLYGSASLVDVANGRMWSYDATAIDDFRSDPADAPRGGRRSVVMHTADFFGHPNLADAVNDPERNVASASVTVDGGTVRLEYPADTRGYDAVSAVLMSETIDNDFIVEPALGARSEWVIGFPTRQFYADTRLVAQTAVAPFTRVSGSYEGDACEGVAAHGRDREGVEPGCLDFPEPPPGGACPPALDLCLATQSIPFTDRRARATTAADSFLGPSLATTFSSRALLDSRLLAGTLEVDLAGGLSRSSFFPEHRMRPALDGTTLDGLPAVGFLAVEYTNSNARPGLLGNYTGTYSHRFKARCTRGDGTACRP